MTDEADPYIPADIAAWRLVALELDGLRGDLKSRDYRIYLLIDCMESVAGWLDKSLIGRDGYEPTIAQLAAGLRAAVRNSAPEVCAQVCISDPDLDQLQPANSAR